MGIFVKKIGKKHNIVSSVDFSLDDWLKESNSLKFLKCFSKRLLILKTNLIKI